MNALGMVEVCGFTTSICCADIAAKAADVKIIALDKNKPAAGDSAEVPLIMNVKMEGSVAAVEMAVQAASAYAKEKNLFVTSHIIPRPGNGTEKMAFLSDVGRDRWVSDAKVKEEPVVKMPKAEEIPEVKPEEKDEVKVATTPEEASEPKKRGRKPKPKA